MFLGGWATDRSRALLGHFKVAGCPGVFWLFAKFSSSISCCSSGFVRRFQRYRYDQIMRLGWKVFIPLTLVWLVVIVVWMQTPWNIWSLLG